MDYTALVPLIILIIPAIMITGTVKEWFREHKRKNNGRIQRPTISATNPIVRYALKHKLIEVVNKDTLEDLV